MNRKPAAAVCVCYFTLLFVNRRLLLFIQMILISFFLEFIFSDSE